MLIVYQIRYYKFIELGYNMSFNVSSYNRIRCILFLVVSLLGFSIGHCGTTDKIAFTQGDIRLSLVNSEVVSESDELKLYLQLSLNLQDQWYSYGHMNQEIGKPTEIDVSINSDHTDNVSIYWPKPEVKKLNNSSQIYYYSSKTDIPVVVQAKNHFPMELSFIVNYVLCNELCIPRSDVLNLNLTAHNIKNNKKVHNVDKLTYINTEIYDLFFMFIIALAGGMILNLMPCTLPVLSIKLLSFAKAKRKNSKNNIKIQLYAMIAGIITVFVCFAFATVLLKSFGQIIGIGMHFQNPYFILSVILVIYIMVCNSMGDFEIEVPSFIYKLIPHNKRKNVNTVISFFMNGVVATLLATPCTAPFIGTAVSFALTNDIWVIFFIFITIAFGMSFPYFLFIIFPNMVQYLPKSGNIFVKIKKILAVTLIITILWLCHLLSYHMSEMAVMLLLVLLIGARFCIKKYSAHRVIIMVATFLVSYILMQYGNQMAHEKKYGQTHEDQLKWEEFQYDLISYHVSKGDVVLVDITAAWCITCQYNKFTVLNNTDVVNILKGHNIKLLRGDYTNHNAKIADYLNARTQYGIPYNVIYGPGAPHGLDLNPLLSRKELEAAILKAKS